MRLTIRQKDGTIISQKGIDAVLKKLADYEDAEENGFAIKVPCRLYDTVFIVPSIAEYILNIKAGLPEKNTVIARKLFRLAVTPKGEYFECCKTDFNPDGSGMILLLDNFRKTWFLKETEAKERLKELKELEEDYEQRKIRHNTNRGTSNCPCCDE